MRRLLAKFEEKRTSELISVHKNLVHRMLPELYRYIPEARDIFEPHMEIFIDTLCAPDRDGDREVGTGKHYYCACNSFGMKLSPVAGYYKNGIVRFSQSARSMMEEDYTMALTCFSAGFHEEALCYLARALHMLEDMCCLPHATRMTYCSPKKQVHRAYEDLAKMMYPDSVPSQEIKEADLHFFDSRKSFTKALNALVEPIPNELPLLLSDPEFAITHRIYAAEKAVIAFLYRFCTDLKLTPEKAHYITDGMRFRIVPGLPPLTVKVTANGIVFLHNGRKTRFGMKKFLYFRAAHRSCGDFTFSPVGDAAGRSLIPEQYRLAGFDPRCRGMRLRPCAADKNAQ